MVKASKRNSELMEEANKVWPLDRYDKEGRLEHDRLTEKKKKIKPSQYDKWPALDKYLWETHFPKMQKQLSRQETDRAVEEEARSAEEGARAARLARLAAKRAQPADKSADDTDSDVFQRREVLICISIC
jgi:hypothetical protein